MTSADDYALRTSGAAEVPAPDLPYQPPRPLHWRPRIALIGAGGIAAAHLDAYRAAGFDVAVICNRSLPRAVARRDEFFPGAEVSSDVAATIARPDIDILDLTPHPDDRLALIEAGVRAGKHVLSQKPFVTDLDTGARLADLAEARGVMLAVNQNGRWAPHMAWMRAAVAAGHVGAVQSVNLSVFWDHSWIKGTPFEAIHDLILFDFAVHWFDFLASLLPTDGAEVFARTARSAGQTVAPPMLAQVLVGLPGAQAQLAFDAATRFGPRDRSLITGSLGTLISDGPDLGSQSVTLTSAAGRASPTLEGHWFNDGFAGTMGALMRAVEENRQPIHSARGNLATLALVFAAIASAREGRPVVAGRIRSLAAARG